MNPQQIINRTRELIFNPAATWEVIRGEEASAKSLYQNWILPLAAIGPIASFIGNTMFGIKVPFTGAVIKMGFGEALSNAVFQYAIGLVMIYVISFAVSKLATNFGGQDNQVAALKLVTFSALPGWLVGVLGITGSAGLMSLAGLISLYGIYLFYLGATPLMNVASERRFGYIALCAVAAVVLSLVVGVGTAGLTHTPGLQMP